MGNPLRLVASFEKASSIQNLHFGPMGERGPTGTTGTTGTTGPTGTTGITGPFGATNFTWSIQQATRLIDSNTVVGNPTAPFNAFAYTFESYQRSAALSFTNNLNYGFAVGLSQYPSANINSINYGIWVRAGQAGYNIVQLGTLSSTYQFALPPFGSGTTHTFQIVYDGVNVRYYVDTVVVFTTYSPISVPYHMIVSYEQPTTVKDLHFAPGGEKGDTGTTGPTGATGPTVITGPTGVFGDTTFTWALVRAVQVNSSAIRGTPISGGPFSAYAYSVEGYKFSAFLSFTSQPLGGYIVGFTTLPSVFTTNINYGIWIKNGQGGQWSE
jgi:collagen type VII alpha